MERKRFVEVYEKHNRAEKKGVLELLDEELLPAVGDILLLSRSGTGDSEEQAFFMVGMATPFRVVEREFVYVRDSDYRHHPTAPKGARWSTAIAWVERVDAEAYWDTPPLSTT